MSAETTPPATGGDQPPPPSPDSSSYYPPYPYPAPSSSSSADPHAAPPAQWQGYQGYSQYAPPPPTHTVEMRITASAANIPKMDGLFGKADPYLVVTCAEPDGTRRLVFKSEVVRNTLAPSWQPFCIDLQEAGGDSNPLLWEAFDWDPDGKHDFIGGFTATLAQLAQQSSFRLMNPERKTAFGKSKPDCGTFTVSSCETLSAPARALPSAFRLVLRGEKLSRKDLFSSDPFLVVHGRPWLSASGLPPHVAHWHETIRQSLFHFEQQDIAAAAASKPSGKSSKQQQQQQQQQPARYEQEFVVIRKTEVIRKTLNPTWNALEIPLALAGGMHQRLMIVCYDYNDDGTHSEIGRCYPSLKMLSSPDPLIPLINPERMGEAKGLRKYANSGLLRVSLCAPLAEQPPAPAPAYDVAVSMKSLARMDFGGLGKCDPFIQISARVFGLPHPEARPVANEVVVFKSEIVYKSLAPTFKPFQLAVLDCGGMDGPLRFQVFDKDPQGQELVGEFFVTLREMAFAQYNTYFLKNPKHFSAHSGVVTFNSVSPSFQLQQSPQAAPAFDLHCSALRLASAHYHLAFAVFAGQGGAQLLSSEVVANSRDSAFKPLRFEVHHCGGLDAPLYFEFADYIKPSQPAVVGGFTTSLRELTLAHGALPPIPIIDPKKLKSMGYKSSGDFQVTLVEPLYLQPPPNASFVGAYDQPHPHP